MGTRRAEVVICGAGIAGISVAYQLAVRHGLRNVILVDGRPPLSLTSDKSTEAYRNWWPGPDDAMIRLMNRSIDLLEELALKTGNRLQMNRRGYVYATGDRVIADEMRDLAVRAEAQGAGPLRIHTGRNSDPDYLLAPPEGWQNQPSGADLIFDDMLIQQVFPYLSPVTTAVLHARRCGWFSGQQLGMLQLEAARSAGVSLIEGRVESVKTSGGRIGGVRIAHRGGSRHISTPRFVNAAGPMFNQISALLEFDLPVFSELHLKVSIEDHLRVVPRDAPFLIWSDAQRLAWTDDVRAHLAASPETRPLIGTMPAGAHMRPEGGMGSRHVLMLWPYHLNKVPESFPLPILEHYPEVCLRGLATMVPGLEIYRERLPKPFVDGGYYTKTRENRPLACPLPIEGAFVHGALSGFGLMASAATSELVARHIVGDELPPYAQSFHLDRYDDPAYQTILEDWEGSGQL